MSVLKASFWSAFRLQRLMRRLSEDVHSRKFIRARIQCVCNGVSLLMVCTSVCEVLYTVYSACTQIMMAFFSVEEEAVTHQCKLENPSPAFGFNLFCAVCTIACLVQHFMHVFEHV